MTVRCLLLFSSLLMTSCNSDLNNSEPIQAWSCPNFQAAPTIQDPASIFDLPEAIILEPSEIRASCGNGNIDFGEFCPTDTFPIDFGGPTYVEAVDLNSDNYPDLISSTYLGAIQIVTGQGDFDFETNRGGRSQAFSSTLSPGSSSTVSVRSLDFNNDNTIDLVAANITEESLSFIINQEDIVRVATYGQIFGMDVADINNDGYDDIMAVNWSQNGATLFLGNPDFSLDCQRQITTGIEPHGGILYDIDQDSYIDIIMANAGTHDASPDFISVAYGDGVGNFSEILSYQAGNGPFSVASGDLDQDGYEDLIVANYGNFNFNTLYTRGDQSISILLNAGDGSFSAHHEIRMDIDNAYWKNPLTVTVTDLDQDSSPEILAAMPYNSAVSVLSQNY